MNVFDFRVRKPKRALLPGDVQFEGSGSLRSPRRSRSTGRCNAGTVSSSGTPLRVRPACGGPVSRDPGLGSSIEAASRGVAFRLESDLCEPVATWLQDTGFEVRREVPILGRRADLVGSCETTVMAVEMKMHRWAEALRQAIAYQLAADRVWVAMPLEAACRAYRQRWTFQSEGVGLLAVDNAGRVRSPILAAPSPRLLPFLRDGVRERCRTDPSLLRFPG